MIYRQNSLENQCSGQQPRSKWWRMVEKPIPNRRASVQLRVGEFLPCLSGRMLQWMVSNVRVNLVVGVSIGPWCASACTGLLPPQ